MSTLTTARNAETSLVTLIRIAVESGAQVKIIAQGHLSAELGSATFDNSVQIADQLDDQVQMIEQIWQLMRSRYRDVAANAGHGRHQNIVIIIDDPARLTIAADPAPKAPSLRRSAPWWRRLISGDPKDPQLQPDSIEARIGALIRIGRAVDIHVNVVVPPPDARFVTAQFKEKLAQVRWAAANGCLNGLTDERKQS